MKQIGQGAFTTAYQYSSDKVLLRSKDPIKECMALGFFPISKLFPTVQRTGLADRTGCQTYIMKYYPKMAAPKKQLNSKHYKLYRELRDVMCNTSNFDDRPLEYAIDKYVSDNKYRQVMFKALDACIGYTSCPFDVRFEISPRNVSFTPSGRLILLDCFFLVSALK